MHRQGLRLPNASAAASGPSSGSAAIASASATPRRFFVLILDRNSSSTARLAPHCHLSHFTSSSSSSLSPQEDEDVWRRRLRRRRRRLPRLPLAWPRPPFLCLSPTRGLSSSCLSRGALLLPAPFTLSFSSLCLQQQEQQEEQEQQEQQDQQEQHRASGRAHARKNEAERPVGRRRLQRLLKPLWIGGGNG